MNDVRDAVVVTGAARGIGAGIALRFAEAGWSVIAVDISDDVAATADKIAAETGSVVTGVVADLASDAGRGSIAESVRSVGGLRAIVNNAGITRDAMLKNMTPEQFTATSRVNLGGAIQLIDALLPEMVDGAAIVNVSSKSASGNFGQFNYATSKAGLLGYTRSLARQVAPRIRVNAISPGFIATEMTDAIPEELRTSILERIPLGRPGQPRDIADVALWLASDQSSYVTGQVVAVCGGRTYAP
jgi:NAD(P)-dependent dehydrogenase (short-subunit alcohol dehydrogenase family)